MAQDEATRPDPEQTCWVCFGSPEDAPRAEWVAPCRCSGSMKWVHQACLRRWINDESGSSRDRHSCPQCQAPYTIIEPPHSRLVAVGDSLNTALDAASPVAAVTAGVLCFWAGLGVYGAVTFAHVCGQEGRHIIRQMHPVKLFLLMPMVPISLVILRMRHAINLRLRTSDGRLQLSVAARQTDDAPREAETTRGTGHVARGRGGVEGHPGEAAEEEEAHLVDVQREAAEEGDEDLQLPEIISQMKTSRIVLGGLMLPYMSMAIGKVFLAPWHLHPFDRAVYGGLLYEILTSVYDHVYMNQKRAHRLQRRIVSYVQ